MQTELPMPLTTWTVVGIRSDNANIYSMVNDVISPGLPIIGTLRSGDCIFGLGYSPAIWAAFDGKIAEVLAWDQALSDADYLAAYAYLRAKYSLP